MPDRTFEHTISDGDDVAAEPVMDNFNRLKSWFTTTAGLGISNSDIATDAAILGSKINIDSNTDWSTEHESDGTHTFSDNGCEGLFITPDSTNPQHTLAIKAASLTLEDSDGNLKKVTSVSEAVAIATWAENGRLLTTAEAASTYYLILILCDTGNSDNVTAALYAIGASAPSVSPSSELDTTFWETDLVAFNSEVSATYDYAKVVGLVFNDANSDFEVPRPIAGAGVGDGYLPTYTLLVAGTYTGTGSGQSVTGVGFLPEVLIIKNQNGSGSAVLKTENDTGNWSHMFGASASESDCITSLDYDGFTVGSDSKVDGSGNTMVYLAFKQHKPATVSP